MAATLRPVTLDDVTKRSTPIKNSSGMYIDVIHNIGSDDDSYGDIEIVELSRHMRQYIKLNRPTFNYVLAQSGATLLRSILNFPKKTWDSIIDYKVVYSVANDEFVSIDSAMDGEDYLVGAEIAEYFIDKFDVEKAIIDCLYTNFIEFYCRKYDNIRSIIGIDKTVGGYHLVGNYYAHFDPTAAKQVLKRGLTVDDIQDTFADNLLRNSETVFTYLLNMPRDKSSLYGMLNYYIIIVPQDMRPSMDNRDHKLTKLYSNVIIKNNALKTALSNNQIIVKNEAYKGLDIAVRNLQAVNKGKSKADDTAILERIKSKTGQIRGKNLSKRQDYSGRAVVCINPFLPLDVVRIPEEMIVKLFQHHALKYLAEGVKIVKDYKDLRNSETAGYSDSSTHIEANNKQIIISKYEELMRNGGDVYHKIRLNNLNTPEAKAEIMRIIKEQRILEKVPVVLGRQPTLHKQSLQGFHVEPTPFSAIEVNPLICPAFNMDFDGDQAHVEVPISDEAIKEVNDLVLTTQNLFLAKTGDCTTKPRQEMLYGLWMCTRDNYQLGTPVATYATNWEIRDAVMYHKVKVSDTVTSMELKGNVIAGDAAVIACFAPGEVLPRDKSQPGKMTVCQIDSKNISKFVDYLLRINADGSYVHKIGSGFQTGPYKVDNPHHNTSTFVGALDAIVELGFRVARLYPCDLSILGEMPNIPAFDNAVVNFHKDMEEVDFLYNIGLETPDNYKIEFAEKLDVLNNTRKETINDKLGGDTNGYVKLSKSGARGSADNLLQSFSIKGKVKKNETESFDALIENSYLSQLTPLEHFVAAYGGRQGQIDKSLKTGDTGYAMREMWHATQELCITSDDCGTTSGVPISKKELAIFIDDEDPEKIKTGISEIFQHTLYGKFEAGSNRLISQERAKELANDPNVEKVYIRSPLTCNNPCCVKCYGIDWSTRKLAIKGLPVGIIAAQAIGESGTQLSLDQFHKGGIAEKASSISAFDKVNNYINMANIAKKSKEGKYPSYDPLAWDTGKVIRQKSSVIGKDKVTILGPRNSKDCIIVPSTVVLKEDVKRGEGLTFTHGDYDINEVLTYNGILAAQKYLMFKLYSLFKSEFNIRISHFECLVASMTRYMIVSTDRKDLMVGQYASAKELYSGSIKNTKYIARIVGVKELPRSSHSALDGIIMENHVKGLSRACLLGLTDDLTKPINNLVLGLPGTYGSAIPGFMDSRKEII